MIVTIINSPLHGRLLFSVMKKLRNFQIFLIYQFCSPKPISVYGDIIDLSCYSHLTFTVGSLSKNLVKSFTLNGFEKYVLEINLAEEKLYFYCDGFPH